MLLCFFYVFLSLLGVVEGCARIVVDLNQVCSLLVHLCVDLLGNVIDIRHELLHIVQLVLPLLNQIVHVGCFTLHPQLINIELLLFQELLILLIPSEGGTALVIHEGLAALH